MIVLSFLDKINIGEWLAGTGIVFVAGIIVTFLRKKGLALNFKSFSKKAAKITKELGEALLETSDVFEEMNQSIRNDSTLVESNVKDVIAAGKEAVIEWKDVIVIFKPKK